MAGRVFGGSRGVTSGVCSPEYLTFKKSGTGYVYDKTVSYDEASDALSKNDTVRFAKEFLMTYIANEDVSIDKYQQNVRVAIERICKEIVDKHEAYLKTISYEVVDKAGKPVAADADVPEDAKVVINLKDTKGNVNKIGEYELADVIDRAKKAAAAVAAPTPTAPTPTAPAGNAVEALLEAVLAEKKAVFCEGERAVDREVWNRLPDKKLTKRVAIIKDVDDENTIYSLDDAKALDMVVIITFYKIDGCFFKQVAEKKDKVTSVLIKPTAPTPVTIVP